MDPETPVTIDTSLWSTKRTEMTGGDVLKLGVGLAAITAVMPYAVAGTIAGVKALWHKHQSRKVEQVPEITPETPEDPPTKK